MNKRPIKVTAASVKQRLLNLAKTRGEEFNFVLTRFAVERLLFRLSQSKHAGDFVLKGGMLFHLRGGQVPHRPTRDLDLLGTGSPDVTRMEGLFADVCRADVPDDGLTFLAEHVKGERIKDDAEYTGVRVHLEARMGAARIPIQVDVGFGDAVTPSPTREVLLTLLDFPVPSLLVYPWETVIAEKFQAIMDLGMDNSRMKDYFDLHYLAKSQTFEGPLLARAIKAACTRRRTPLPTSIPVGLSPTFAEDRNKGTQWHAFVRKLKVEEVAIPLSEIVAGLRAFLMPSVQALLRNELFEATWPPGGPWRFKANDLRAR